MTAPLTPAEHRAEAERLLREARDPDSSWSDRPHLAVATAHVHAVLAETGAAAAPAAARDDVYFVAPNAWGDVLVWRRTDDPQHPEPVVSHEGIEDTDWQALFGHLPRPEDTQ